MWERQGNARQVQCEFGADKKRGLDLREEQWGRGKVWKEEQIKNAFMF